MSSHLWIKASGNLAMSPISALTGATLVGICRFRRRPVGRRHDGRGGEIAERLGLRLPLSVEQHIEDAEAFGEHKTSMLQDVEAGRPLEIEPLIGVVP